MIVDDILKTSYYKRWKCRYSRWMLNTAHCTVGKNCPKIFWMCSKLIHSERTFPRVVRSGPTILKTHFQSILCIGCELLVMFDWYFGDQTIMCYGKPLFEMCWFYKGICQIALDPTTEQTFSSFALLLIKYFPLFPSLGPNV